MIRTFNPDLDQNLMNVFYLLIVYDEFHLLLYLQNLIYVVYHRPSDVLRCGGDDCVLILSSKFLNGGIFCKYFSGIIFERVGPGECAINQHHYQQRKKYAN
ncbi:hypothetical protein DERP_010621 [Dermatophagoides pteronyssinus]|uniref:Uncharacterized protein n=1 Tax=Dermatophagoides pteronyssinus TaxID=6956 RepID=A0ABQ8J9Z9_DERPT|nr:hypothetical protein DERP_010621 [Dermatophagoides pteronyssinus]